MNIKERGGKGEESAKSTRADKGESGTLTKVHIYGITRATSAHTKDGGSLDGEIVGIFRFPRTCGSTDSVRFSRVPLCPAVPAVLLPPATHCHSLIPRHLRTVSGSFQLWHTCFQATTTQLQKNTISNGPCPNVSLHSNLSSKLNEEQKRSALANVPSLLEVIGFSYFYGGFLVGPQFTLRSYQRLVKGELTDCPGQPPNSVIPAMKRFSLGLLCLVIYAIFSPHYPDSYYLTDEYDAQPFWYRCVFILLWAKVILYKYVSCWVIAEGVCILSGLGYNGLGQNGEHQWDACANMKVWTFETTPLFTGTIASFNINTNAWVARHVFKRLKFLGNKLLSQVTALAFLAIWHGTHSGYLLCFSMEFIIVNVERQAQALVRDSPLLTRLANSPLYPLIYLVQQFIHWLFMGYPLVPFCLFTYDKWLRVYSSIYFCGHIFFFTLYLGIPYLRKVLVPRKERSEKKED
uniref:Lysophospholipid acyltransferase 5 n=1 Tax=Salmo trutta TaxID=8032 RepID=A0A673WQ44_SALTR